MIEPFSRLLRCDSEDAWRKLVFEIAGDHGYPYVLLAIFPGHHVPMEMKSAFLHSNHAPSWRARYEQDLWRIDPTVAHCLTKTTPLVWSSQIFSGREQHKMYEEACRHGIRAGVSLPMHGTRGEYGVLCFASDAKPNARFMQEAYEKLPSLSCLRDYVLETALLHMKRANTAADSAAVTSREIECLSWSAAGKTSWEIAQILCCSEATVNFHFKNLRRKFDVTSRQQAVVKAMRIGLLSA